MLREQYKQVCMENTNRGRINRLRYEAFRLHGSAVDPGICISDQYFVDVAYSEGFTFSNAISMHANIPQMNYPPLILPPNICLVLICFWN